MSAKKAFLIKDKTIGMASNTGGEILNDYENNQAFSKYSIAAGNSTIAGLKGYYIDAINIETKKIYIRTDKIVATIITENRQPDSTFETPAYEIGDEFSLIVAYEKPNQRTHFHFVSKITSIENNVIGYDNPLPFTTLFEDSADFSPAFLVPSKPLVGVIDFFYGQFAEGELSIAAGEAAHAEGLASIAAGNFGHAEGRETKAGYAAHSEGIFTEAKGVYSHAEGKNSIASETAAHAEGESTASGAYSHSEGSKTLASGRHAHAEGNGTQATGEYGSHAEGQYSIASGKAAHAEGRDNVSVGDYSHSEGFKTQATMLAAHAEGFTTSAEAIYSHAEGENTIAASRSQHVQGKWNVKDDANKYAHIVGNGSSETSRANAHTVDWNGNGWFSGKVTIGSNKDNLATENYVNDNISKSIIGKKGSGSGSEVFNDLTNNVASGNYSHAEGYNTKVAAGFSHGEGRDNEIKSNSSYSHAEGYKNIISEGANGTHAEGYLNTIQTGAHYSHIEGQENVVAARGAHAEGLGTEAASWYQHVQGRYNEIDSNPSGLGKYAHIIGNGTNKSNRKNIHTVDWSGNTWFAGDVTVGANNDKLVTEADIDVKLASIVDSAPETLDTLQELATALGNDENFSTTVLNKIGSLEEKVNTNESIINEKLDDIVGSSEDISILESKTLELEEDYYKQDYGQKVVTTVTNGKYAYVNTDESATISSGSIVSRTTASHTQAIPVLEGEEFIITTRASIYMPAVVFYNSSILSSDNYIGFSNEVSDTTNLKDILVVVPKGATHMVVNTLDYPSYGITVLRLQKVPVVNNLDYLNTRLSSKIKELTSINNFAWKKPSKGVLSIRIDGFYPDMDIFAKEAYDRGLPIMLAGSPDDANLLVSGITDETSKIGTTRLDIMNFVLENDGEILLRPKVTITDGSKETIQKYFTDASIEFERLGINIRGTSVASVVPTQTVKEELDSQICTLYDYSDGYGTLPQYNLQRAVFVPSNFATMDVFKSWVDDIGKNKLFRTIILHRISDEFNSTFITSSMLIEMLDYIKSKVDSGSIDVMSWSKLYDTYRDTDNNLSIENLEQQIQENESDKETKISALETQIKNVEDRSQAIYTNALKGSATGETIALKDTSPVEHIMDVKVRKKNLLSFPYKQLPIGVTEANGLTITVDNQGVITINGTATANMQYILAQDRVALPAGLKHGDKITLSKNSNDTAQGINFTCNYIDANGTQQSGLAAGAAQTATATISDKWVGYLAYLWITKDKVYNNFIIKPQIELGSVATGWSPYLVEDISTVKLLVEETATKYAVNTDGTVNGVKSIYPNMTLTTDTVGAVIDCEYNRDINKAFAELQQAIISLGGNI